MSNPRTRKILRDLWLHKARTTMVILAIAVGIGAGLLPRSARQTPGGVEREAAVEHHQGLRRGGRDVPRGAGLIGIRLVEGFEERIAQVAARGKPRESCR